MCEIGSCIERTLLGKGGGLAMLNGRSLGLLVGVVGWIWDRDLPLSLVIGSALTINFCSAALGGVLVPLTVKRMGFDPALAGAVILTTVTDVMGFLSFLGLATLILLR